MKEEIFEEVLNEILKELKDNNRLLRGMTSGVDILTAKVDTFADLLAGQQVIAPPADTDPLQKIASDEVVQNPVRPPFQFR